MVNTLTNMRTNTYTVYTAIVYDKPRYGKYHQYKER